MTEEGVHQGRPIPPLYGEGDPREGRPGYRPVGLGHGRPPMHAGRFGFREPPLMLPAPWQTELLMITAEMTKSAITMKRAALAKNAIVMW